MLTLFDDRLQWWWRLLKQQQRRLPRRDTTRWVRRIQRGGR
jgi:hypothetical protein